MQFHCRLVVSSRTYCMNCAKGTEAVSCNNYKQLCCFDGIKKMTWQEFFADELTVCQRNAGIRLRVLEF